MLTDSNSLSAVSRPWYKRPWFVSIAILVLVWFGVPMLLRMINPSPAQPTAEGTLDGLPSSNIPLSRIETTDDPSKGSPAAPIVIVEFSDFQCPFCKESAPIIKQVLQEYPEAVRLIYRDFPVAGIHAQAIAAAEAANCADKQEAFWSYHDALFDNQGDLGDELYLALAQSLRLDLDSFQSCLDQHLGLSEIQSDLSDGLAAGVKGTPTWFINGHKVDGSLTIEMWRKLVEGVLRATFSNKQVE